MLLIYITTLGKFSKTTTSLNVKKLNDRENYVYNLETCKQVMKFKRNKQISQPFFNASLTIKNETQNDKNEVQIVEENTSAFFKEINLLLDKKILYKVTTFLLFSLFYYLLFLYYNYDELLFIHFNSFKLEKKFNVKYVLFKQSQMKNNTFANATLKQKLSNAMCTTKFVSIH